MDLSRLCCSHWIILMLQFVFTTPWDPDPCSTLSQNEDDYMLNLPKIQILKRQILNPRSGRYATVTIAYQSEVPVEVRWYRVSGRYNLPMSEIPNMLPVQGNDSYITYQLKSDDVYASHLVVQKREGRVPPSYTAVFMVNNSLQYQVHTNILPNQVFHKERLNLPDQIKMYVHKSKRNQPAFVQCVVNIPTNDTKQNHEMGMIYRTVKKEHKYSTRYHASWERLGEIWQNVSGIGRHADNKWVKLHRKITPAGLQYKITYCVNKLSLKNIGFYHCRYESANSVINVRSALEVPDLRIPSKPVVQLIPCESGIMKGKIRWTPVVVLSDAYETCLRCRATGAPGTKVSIRKNKSPDFSWPGADLSSYPNVTKVTYTDISDIRDSAVTYILHGVSEKHSGYFLCYAKYSSSDISQQFVIQVVKEKKRKME